VIPRRWTLDDYAQHSCSDHSHAHLSRAELADSLKHGLVELVRYEDRRQHHKAIVRVVRILSVRGLSCRVGEALALMLASDNARGTALTMLSQIRMRRETREDAPLLGS
jgi:hypothetical protein